MIYVEDRHMNMLKEILGKYIKKSKIYAYGSRVKGNHRVTSDLDLAVEPLEDIKWSELQYELDESRIPFMVSVLNIPETNEDFLNRIRKDFVEILL